MSVASGRIKDAIATLSQNNITGSLIQQKLNCVLFDHIMLESEEKAIIPNYKDLVELLKSADIKTEVPYDMVEWIWIHMKSGYSFGDQPLFLYSNLRLE